MLVCLRGSRLFTGHRGVAASPRPADRMALRFSDLVMALGDRIDSIDLTPCSARAALRGRQTRASCWRRI